MQRRVLLQRVEAGRMDVCEHSDPTRRDATVDCSQIRVRVRVRVRFREFLPRGERRGSESLTGVACTVV